MDGPINTSGSGAAAVADCPSMSSGTLAVVRTECCESFRICGIRCSNCPNRAENREAVLRYKQQAPLIRLGRRYTFVVPTPAASAAGCSHSSNS